MRQPVMPEALFFDRRPADQKHRQTLGAAGPPECAVVLQSAGRFQQPAGLGRADLLLEQLLFGPVEKVYCVNARRAAPLVDDTTNVMMTHKNGAISNLLCTLSSAVHYRIAVYGSRGLAETEKLSFDTLRIIPAPDKPPSGAHQTAEPQIIENKGFNQVKAALEAFAGAVRGKAPFPITPDQILHGVAVFEAIEKSAKSGKPAKVG